MSEVTDEECDSCTEISGQSPRHRSEHDVRDVERVEEYKQLADHIGNTSVVLGTCDEVRYVENSFRSRTRVEQK